MDNRIIKEFGKVGRMSVRWGLQTFVFAKIGNQQLYTFVSRNMCDIRMTHVASLSRVKVVKTFKSVMNRMVLGYVAPLLAIGRGGYLATVFHRLIGSNMDQQSKHQKQSIFQASFHLSLLTAANIGLLFIFFAKSGLQKSIF